MLHRKLHIHGGREMNSKLLKPDYRKKKDMKELILV